MLRLGPLLRIALLLATVAPCAVAEDERPRRLAVPADMLTHGETAWYGIYFGKSKVGWALRQLGPLSKRGDRFLRSRYVLHMVTKSRGKLKTTHIERRKIYDPVPPFRLRGASATTRRGEFVKRVVLSPQQAGLVARIREGEQERRLTVTGGAAPTFADETTPMAWIRSRPRAGDTLRYRTLDLSRLRVGTNTLRIRGDDRRDIPGTYEAELVSASGDTDRVLYDARGTMERTRMLGLMEVRREARARAQQLGEAFDPSVRGDVKIDRPIGEAEYVRNMVVRVRGAGAEHVRSAPGQAASYDARKKILTLRIGPRLAPPVKATPAEIERALAEDATYPIRHRIVQALAKETVAQARTTKEKVEALVEFVKEFVIDSHTVDPLTVMDVLARQRGDCNEHALLFTTLARAAGIPSREVYGLIYKDDNRRVFGRHAWSEVVVDGVWLPVDPMWGEMQLSAAHVRLGAKDEGPNLRLALAGARMELVSLDTEPAPPDPDRGH